MAVALDEARAAMAAGEVPVGAVLVKDGAEVARGRNAPLARRDPTSHAEIAALRRGARALDNYRLEGCTLYVTLEPCAMCAGAMLHARLDRLVFGAPDPRTGAAGSVVDLFADPRLNHHTKVQGGVMAPACGQLLQSFFHGRREAARMVAQPLRDDALRTAESRFAEAALPWPPRFASDLPALSGLRMAWLDTAPGAAGSPVCVCVHGAGQWSRQTVPLVEALVAAGCPRVLAPDLIGFGRSDKPKRVAAHAIGWHRDALAQWLAREAPGPKVLLACQSMRELAEALAATLAQDCRALVLVAEENAPELEAAARAPFPDRGHEAALRAFGPSRPARRIGAAEAARAAREAMGYSAP